MVKFLDLNMQYLSIQKEIDAAITSVITEGAFIRGKYVEDFEKKFAHYIGASHCIGVGNGTDAIEIALEALNLPKGSEVIVPANSFIASSEAVTRAGHKVVFCEIDSDNYTLSLSALEQAINENTSAVIAVHLYGHPCDMDPLVALCEKHEIAIIEDCAQAHGALYKNKMVGTFGKISTFSFYPGKNLGAFGDAGAIITNDSELAKKSFMIANHGRVDKYDHQFEGRNSRMDGLQGAILGVKLNHLDGWITKRRAIAQRYLSELADIPSIKLPKIEKWALHAYHLFVIQIQNRNKLKDFLSDKKIQTGVHYPIALPDLAAYGYLHKKGAYNIASQAADMVLSLPIGEHLKDRETSLVINAIREYCSNA